ncbi:hypothetical protein B0H13DRAFT_1883813 [Mycena leptocephala]|nr:hypothetical protein B0H13DRAFT_1883813 [Mycena leptocephala]
MSIVHTYAHSYAARFLDRECIDIPVLKKFLGTPAAGDLKASRCTDVSAAESLRSPTSPDNVDEEMLAKSLANQTLSDDSETPFDLSASQCTRMWELNINSVV